MANAVLNNAALDFARSLEFDTIPEKLRCATCNKLAIQAVKLPCCDSTICGDCHSNLTESECPVCTHSPFAADTCTSAKSLQTTVKVFIRNEARKRGLDLTGAVPAPIAAAPEVPPATPMAAPAVEETFVEPVSVPAPARDTDVTVEEHETPIASTEDAPQLEMDQEPSSSNGHVDESGEKPADSEQDDEEDDDDDDVVITTERPDYEEQQTDTNGQEPFNAQDSSNDLNLGQSMQMDQQQGFNNNFNPGMAGFGGPFDNSMNMNGFNPMMGMQGFGMGMPNMMGMPGMGMGMDPSMIFGGMGDMSAMMGMGNMGMGGGMPGMGNFNGMNGPSGFFPNQGNYMQSQNYGNPQRQNFHNDRGYGRGYGRGFGRGARGNQYGRGRGGWGYQQQQYGQSHNQSAYNQSAGGPPQSAADTAEVASHRRGSPTYGSVQGQDGDSAETGGQPHDDQYNGIQDANSGTNHAEHDTNEAGEPSDHVRKHGDAPSEDASDTNQPRTDQADGVTEASGMTNGTVVDPSAQGNGYNIDGQANLSDGQQGLNSFGGRGGFRGRGGYGSLGNRDTDSTELTPAVAPPINAPKGPKAMREGLPNTGWASRRNGPQQPTPTPAAHRAASQVLPAEPPREEASKRDEHTTAPPDRSASPVRSYRRSSKDREPVKDEDYEDEEERAYRRERRKRKERERREEEDARTGHDSSRKHRSRSDSPTDDSSRRRHRDKDGEHRSSRSHRDRSKDRHRSRRHDKENEDDDYSRRKSKGDRERDDPDDYRDRRSSRKHSHREDEYEKPSRSSRHDRSSRDERRESDRSSRAIIEPPSDELGFKIKGSKSLRAEKDKMAPPAAPAVASDPYAEERARAQKDRENREAQRRLSTQTGGSSQSLGKRSRDVEDDLQAPTGPKSDRDRRAKKGRKERRISYKYEDELDGAGGGDSRDADRWN